MGIFSLFKKAFRVFAGTAIQEVLRAKAEPYPFFCLCDGKVTPARDLYAANSICRDYQLRNTRLSDTGEVIRPKQCCFYDAFGNVHYPWSQMTINQAIRRENEWKKRMGIA